MLAFDLEPVLVHRLQEATPAQLSGRESPRTRQVGDPAMAERDQVLDGQRRALAVVRHHGEGAASLDRAIDQHHRPAGRHHLGHDLIVGARRSRSRSRRPGGPPASRPAAARGQDPRPSTPPAWCSRPRPSTPSMPRIDRREQRVGEVGDDHADREGLARLQAARDRVRRIAEPAGRPVDAPLRCARSPAGASAGSACATPFRGERPRLLQRRAW